MVSDGAVPKIGLATPPTATAPGAPVEVAVPAPVPPDPNPSWNMETFLGGVKIVPGSAVKQSLQEISSAQTVLKESTWGEGKLVAGLASVPAQMSLAKAERSYTAWQNNIDEAKNAVAKTVDVPIAHQLAQLSLLATLMLPSSGESALKAASFTVPIVGLFGAPTAAAVAGQLVSEARVNGQVYRVVPFVMSRGVNEIARISINNGPRIPVVLDTGSSGTSTTSQYVGQTGLGPSTGMGSSGYGDGPTAVYYNYDKYTTKIKLGRGILTGPTTVNVVTEETAQGYNSYQYPDGIVGVVGQAANRGAGPNNFVTLPGELKDGALMVQFKYWGVTVLGPNPLPVRVSVPGVPDAYVQVQINDGPKQLAKGVIDSGGVQGLMPIEIMPGKPGEIVPAGTKISVYNRDGSTLLYSYTTTKTNSPSFTESEDFNTGNVPFRLGQIYVDYSQKDGIGTTAFAYF